MKEMHELALAAKSVTNTGFTQPKPLHSLIRKEWLEYFSRLASISSRTAACSELSSGVSMPPLRPHPDTRSRPAHPSLGQRMGSVRTELAKPLLLHCHYKIQRDEGCRRVSHLVLGQAKRLS